MRYRSLVFGLGLLLLMGAAATGADSVKTDADGVVTWTPEMPGPKVVGKYKPGRWGTYDIEVRLEAPAAGKIKASVDGKDLTGTADGAVSDVKLGRIHLDGAGERPVTIETEPADAGKPVVVKQLVLTPAPEGKPITQADDLSITLHARDATVHGVNLRYEFRPDKNTLGYWSNSKDWVSWDFEVKKPGKFVVYVMQGSPGTKDMEITAGQQVLKWQTKNTGSFHTFTFVEAGTLAIEKAGHVTLDLKPAKDVKGSIMDLRQVMLLPELK